MEFSKNSDSLHCITNPQRLNKDESTIFDFIEKLIPLMNSLDGKEIYCKYIISLVNFDVKNFHSEAIYRRSFEILDNFFNIIEDNDFKFKYIPQILSEVNNICSLINDMDSAMILLRKY